jgi:hypothetical protein
MEIACPPELSSSDISELTILMANIIDSFLQHNKPHEINKHEQQNSAWFKKALFWVEKSMTKPTSEWYKSRLLCSSLKIQY